MYIMKTGSIFLFLLLALPASLFSQVTSVLDAFESMSLTFTPLPYNGLKSDVMLEPSRVVHCPVEQLEGKTNTALWADMQLTQPAPNDYDISDIYRRFKPTNGDYWLGAVRAGTGGSGNSKVLLVTLKPDGTFIDALEVKFRASHGIDIDYIYLKQWKIDRAMRVTVYQIRPTQTTPIPLENTQTSFVGQRIDTEYHINSTGKFVKLKETKYRPQTYTYSYLADKSKNFWEGNELLLPV
jgi:hypothetical protein